MISSSLLKRKAKWLVNYSGNQSFVLVKEGERVGIGTELVKIVEDVFDYLDLSAVKVDVLKKLLGTKVVANQEISKGIRVLRDGVMVGINEFMMARIRTLEKKEKIIRSPVAGVVVDLEDKSFGISFRAIEIPIRGLVVKKAWGEGKFQICANLSEISNKSSEKILFMDHMDRGMITKAEVLNVAGVVIWDQGLAMVDRDWQIPGGLISKETFLKAVKECGEAKSYRMLLNSKSDRLLVVVQ